MNPNKNVLRFNFTIRNMIRMLRTMLMVLAVSFFTVNAQAQLSTAPVPVRPDAAGRTGVTPPVEASYPLSFITINKTFGLFSVCDDGDFYLGFQLYYDLGDKNTQDLWEQEVELVLLKAGVEQWRETLSLDMESQTFTTTVFHDETIRCTDGYTFQIASKNSVNSPPETNIFVRPRLYKKNEDIFDPYQPFPFTYVQGSHANEVLLDWDHEGIATVEYEVQWVYIDAEDNFTGTTAPQAFAFKEGAGVLTAANYYHLQAWYPNGTLWFRVRSVGINPDYPENRIPGQWQYGTSTSLTIGNHAEETNWQVVNTFAEDGKAKNVMRYMDGSLRERQLLTNLNTDENILVAETLYDFEGRPVVNMLPAPMQATDLNYRSGLNTFRKPTGWDHANRFHYDNYLAANSLLDSASGASQYYSVNNTFSGIHKELVPQARGYVYTQTEYLNDNTGRVGKQSGVGSTFNIDDGKTTRYFYAGATQAELVRLFGSNVGNAHHYRKQAVMDPNNQVSISYLDQEGRAIATALAGEHPENLDPLTSLNEGDWTTITEDISDKKVIEGKTIVHTHQILNTAANTGYDFVYSLSALAENNSEFGCLECAYYLELSVTDPNGRLVELPAITGNESADSKYFRLYDFTAEDCAARTATGNIEINGLVFSEIGEYTVSKKLTAKDISRESLETIVLSDPQVIQEIEEIHSTYVLEESACEFCTSCDVEEIISETISEVVALNAENIYNQIVQEIKDQHAGEEEIYEPTPEEIEAHELYCKYLFYKKNATSNALDAQITRVSDWDEAITKGYDDLFGMDPFFNDPALSGYGARSDMQSRLNNLLVATLPYDSDGDGHSDGNNDIRGPIGVVLDYNNTDYYFNESGMPDASGYHVLYWDLQARASEFIASELTQKLNEQRWSLYMGLYIDQKRQVKLTLGEVNSCAKLKEELEAIDQLPTDPAGIIAYGNQLGGSGPVSDDQVDVFTRSLSFECSAQFSSADQVTIAGRLKTYFDRDEHNMLEFIDVADLSTDPDLIAIDNILQNYGCGLDDVAIENPLQCVRDTTIIVDANPPSTALSSGSTGSAVLRTQAVNTKSRSRDEKLKMQQAISSNYSLMHQEMQRLEEMRREIEERLQVEKDSILQYYRSQNEMQNSTIQSSGLRTLAVTTAALPTQEEYDALIALYNATDGPNWTNNDGWRDADPDMIEDVSGWYGVATASGSVIVLDLSNNQLSGSIPPELGNLSNLRHLYLHNNQLSGSVPFELDDLSTSLEFQFFGNRLRGTLSLRWINNYTDVFLIHNNRFTFSDFLEVKKGFGRMFFYAPQDSVDSRKRILAVPETGLTLTTDIDRTTNPPSVYQWYKDGEAITTADADNHTLTIANVQESDFGDYYYTITNPDAPDLTLTSRIQTVAEGIPVQFCLEYDTENSSYQNNFTIETNIEEVVEQCLASQQKTMDTVIYLVKEKLIEEKLAHIYSSYHTNCLGKVQETLNYSYTPKEYHYTLYYYDQAGNLAQTVPPKGVKPLTRLQVNNFINGTSITEPAHELATRYQYNSLNQLTFQSTPDGGNSKFWYDSKGQLRLSQNAEQALNAEYSYTKYDALGRITEVGEVTDTRTLAEIRPYLDSVQYPGAGDYVLNDITYTVYDIPAPDSLFSSDFQQKNLRSRVSYVFVRETETSDTVATFYSYDAHGNVNTLLQQIPGLGEKRTDYVYDLVSGNVNLVMYQYGEPDQFFHRYDYDADNRLVTVETSADGYIWSRDAKYYYYPHGPLARVELGEHNVQGLDYYYTLQGWLKGVNLPVSGDPGADGTLTAMTGKDEFAFNLGYFDGDYAPIGASMKLPDHRDNLWTRYSESNHTNGLFNGNIAWMATQLPEAGRRNEDGEKQGYQAMLYHYDQLNRIMSASSLADYTTASGFGSRTESSEAYDASYSYDPNGNLLALQRHDQEASLSHDYAYEYYAGTNRLKNTAPSAGEQYQYDEIGNLVRDNAEGTSIEWTPYGKVRKVSRDNGDLMNFRYDASGNRIEKQVVTADTIITTHYIRDASGNVMATYTNRELKEQPIYGSSRVGMYLGGAEEGKEKLGLKHYELGNHLGNVMAVITDNISIDATEVTASVVSVSDYYPFGLSMGGRSFSDSLYRYGFNGKEKDQSFGNVHYDYGFRIYNPEIAKFLSVDPLTKDFPMLTPYQYASNNPIWNIDLDGLEGVQYTEKTISITGETTVKKVVELDVWVGVSQQQSNNHFKSADIQTIQQNLNSEYSGQTDANGTPVEFRFNVKSFNADLISPNDFQNALVRWPKNYETDINGQMKPGGIVLQQVNIPPVVRNGRRGFIQGRSISNLARPLVSINNSAFAPSHTLAHEVLHRFLIFAGQPTNPATVSDHNTSGGLFTYGTTNSSGQVSGTQSISQRNVNDVLQNVPSVKEKVIDNTVNDSYVNHLIGNQDY